MVKRQKLLIIEGLDRSGKDSLAFELQKDGVHEIRVNDYNFCGKDRYYETTRQMMKSDSVNFVHEITTSMAIVELMQTLTIMKQLSYIDTFSIARSFPSTSVFDEIRGVHNTSFNYTIDKILRQFERENDVQIDLYLLKLFVSKEEMERRGSAEDSFEWINYSKIRREYEEYENNVVFTKTFSIDTTNLQYEEIRKQAANLLFTG
jgi:thymidylate kinase